MRLAVAMIAVLAANAHADTAVDREDPPPRPAPHLAPTVVPPAQEELPAAPDGDRKSEELALGLSIGGAVVGSAAAVGAWGAGYAQHIPASLWSGVVAWVAPSAGEWYAGRPMTPGFVLRGVGAAALVYGGISFGCTEGVAGHQFGEGEQCPVANLRGASRDLVFAIGVGGYAAGAIWDIAIARATVRAYNREHAGMTVAPAALPTAHGVAPGVFVSGVF